MSKKKRGPYRKVPLLSQQEIDLLPECVTGNQSGNLVRCCNCGCATYSPVTRGLCRNHYKSLRDIVLSGRATWQSLESLGLIAPCAKRGVKKVGEDHFMNRVESLLSEGAVNVHGNPLAGVELSQLGS